MAPIILTLNPLTYEIVCSFVWNEMCLLVVRCGLNMFCRYHRDCHLCSGTHVIHVFAAHSGFLLLGELLCLDIWCQVKAAESVWTWWSTNHGQGSKMYAKRTKMNKGTAEAGGEGNGRRPERGVGEGKGEEKRGKAGGLLFALTARRENTITYVALWHFPTEKKRNQLCEVFRGNGTKQWTYPILLFWRTELGCKL